MIYYTYQCIIHNIHFFCTICIKYIQFYFKNLAKITRYLHFIIFIFPNLFLNIDMYPTYYKKLEYFNQIIIAYVLLFFTSL